MNRPNGGSEKRPLAATVSDFLAVVLIMVGTAVIFTGQLRLHLFGLYLAVGSPWRAYLGATLVLAVRQWYVPDDPVLPRLVRTPLHDDERRLFGGPGPFGWRALGELALVTIAFCVFVAAATWPQIRHLDSVPDLGDPLFSVWRIAWVAHQLPRAPLHLFDGNIFYPERLTLTYSDPVLVPAAMSAPLFWLGFHPLTIYNLLFLSGFALSGVGMFLLVRALTGRRDAAAIAGVMFVLYPDRFQHYSHLELQMTMWMPVVLWGLHRTLARGHLRDGIGTGAAFALQALSSLYYGVFLAVYLVPLGAVLWLAHRCPRRPPAALAAGAALASVMIVPVAATYWANSAMLGEREPATIQHYSAAPVDYLKPHFRSRLYHAWSGNAQSERELFPGLTPVLLAAAGLWPPLSLVRIGYAISLGVAFEGSLGFNGTLYPWLYTYLEPFRGLRVPARFALLVGLTLAVLSGYGAARLLNRWPRWRVPLAGVLLILIITDLSPRLDLEPVWHQPPPIYRVLSATSPAVLAEFPMQQDDDSYDTRYLYFSTFHWQKLVNGASGFVPPSHFALLRGVRNFPDDAALDDLRSRAVEYVAVHEVFYEAAEYRRIVKALDARSELAAVSVARWEGKESRLYRLRR